MAHELAGVVIPNILAVSGVRLLGKQPIKEVRSELPIRAMAPAPVGMHLTGNLGPKFAGEVRALRSGIFNARGPAVGLHVATGAQGAINAVRGKVGSLGVTCAALLSALLTTWLDRAIQEKLRDGPVKRISERAAAEDCFVYRPIHQVIQIP
jgi:hypothetical protein